MPDDRLIHQCGSWYRYQLPNPSFVLTYRRWPRSLPRCAGVYVIYMEGALVYIGSSVNLLFRLRSHFASGRWVAEHVSIKFSPMAGIGAAIERERRLIRRLKPLDNREWNSDVKIQPRRLYSVPDGNGSTRMERLTTAEYAQRWGR